MGSYVSGFLHVHNAFEVHPQCNTYQYFIPFYCQVVSHHMNIAHFVIRSPVDGQLDCFCFGAVMIMLL